jgi:hypothetical protein
LKSEYGRKDKGKGFSAHAMKAIRGCKGIAPFILNLSNTWEMVNFITWLFYPQEKPP